MLPKKYNFCNSKLNTTSDEFVWTIDNFSERKQKAGVSLESGIFNSTSPNGNQLQWKLLLFPNSDGRENSKNHLSLFLKIVNPPPGDVNVKYQFTLRNVNGAPSRQLESSNFQKFGASGSSWGYSSFIKREVVLDDKYKVIPGDRLTVACKVTMQEDEVKNKAVEGIEVPESKVVEDMGQLFEQSLFTDCKIVCKDGKEFKVHKCILSCRSRYFAAMFEHGMIEAQNNRVEIKDIRSDVLEQMLRFIYSGIVPNLGEMAEHLLVVADKYGLDRLKILCEKELANSLTNVNACSLLLIANKLCAKHLKAHAIKHIQMFVKEVMETPGWKAFVKGNNGELLAEVMKAIVADRI